MDPLSLLTIKDVQVIGLILAGVVAFILALSSGRIVLKSTVETFKAGCDDEKKRLSDALAAATAENKVCAKDYTEARISIARFEEREAMHNRTRR